MSNDGTTTTPLRRYPTALLVPDTVLQGSGPLLVDLVQVQASVGPTHVTAQDSLSTQEKLLHHSLTHSLTHSHNTNIIHPLIQHTYLHTALLFPLYWHYQSIEGVTTSPNSGCQSLTHSLTHTRTQKSERNCKQQEEDTDRPGWSSENTQSGRFKTQ
jgi:hypothetical protein